MNNSAILAMTADRRLALRRFGRNFVIAARNALTGAWEVTQVHESRDAGERAFMFLA